MTFYLSEINIFANINIEKTNIVIVALLLKRKYTDAHHIKSRIMKETVLQTIPVVFGEKYIERKADNILPPSNPLIGSIFNTPSAMEDIKKSECVPPIAIQATADNTLTNGPAIHKIISSEYE